MIYQERPSNSKLSGRELVREAIHVSKELVTPVIVGAVGVYIHTRTSRRTGDLDLAVERDISNKELLDKKYRIVTERGKDYMYTPRGYRVDIMSYDVSQIPVEQIIQTADNIKVGKGKRETEIKVACIEALIVSKYRASRPRDIEDLKSIAETKYDVIDWEILRTVTKDDHERDMIKMSIDALHNPTMNS
jgi:predicted nucleotidyltransferase